ncbi:hypothetical protein E2562_026234 [Oryza meyeriana var. granulata]|uniref:Uncharacterized protein n=1 Tax=Oryza meyeriana var. granulata TaxID=110450 RepID=A0A6G1CIG5_9ORYZ|nr:hypothetical protein E2562_026234 [Oryza meyeriana var. granulata]
MGMICWPWGSAAILHMDCQIHGASATRVIGGEPVLGTCLPFPGREALRQERGGQLLAPARLSLGAKGSAGGCLSG